MSKYRKTAIALAGAVIAWVGLVVISAPAHITSAEWYSGLVSLGGVFGVFAAPNEKPAGMPSDT